MGLLNGKTKYRQSGSETRWCVRLKGQSHSSGFSLVELLVSLAIFLLVLGLGYNAYYYVDKSYANTENKWVKQREVRKVADFISSEFKNTYSLTVSNTAPVTGVKDEYDLYSSGGNVMLRDGTAAPETLAEGGLSLQFYKVSSMEGADIGNALGFSVSAPDINYSIDSAVILTNISKSNSLTINSTGSAVHLRTVKPIAAVPSMQIDACFIATAAYGTNAEPSVLLLRDFRDSVLLKSDAGRSFVDFYYRNSPPLARIIAGSSLLSCAVMILLTPVVGLVAIIMHKEALLLLMLLSITRFYLNRRRTAGIFGRP